MNDLASALFWSAVQATAIAAAALVLERWAARQGPRAGSWVALTGLILIAVLLPLAFFGLPHWVNGGVTDSSREIVGPSTPNVTGHGGGGEFAMLGSGGKITPTDGASPAPGFAWRLIWRRAHSLVKSWSDSSPFGHPLASRVWCLTWLSGTTWCLLQLAIGLWGVRRGRQLGVQVLDPMVVELVESLRSACGARKPIEVRELPGLEGSAAAAVGWRRPLVLLPVDWRSWNPVELRAVLAHEVAHLAHCDYAAGIAARVSLALHAYHPLVHWIAARLQLQQELAADALAARLAGGSREYLLALSRLALALGNRRLARPARTFLPTKGQLIRRIEMLKEEGHRKNQPLPWTARASTIVVLAALGIAVALVRGPRTSRADDAPARSMQNPVTSSTPSSPAASAKEFDLSFVPESAKGLVAIHPSAIFGVEGMKPYAAKINAMLRQEFGDNLPPLESIEQATFEIRVLPRDKAKNQQGRMQTGDGMLRTRDGSDWPSAVKRIAAVFYGRRQALTEVRLAGKTYFKSTVTNPGKPDVAVYFYCPDPRTVFWTAREENVRRLVEHGSLRRPEFVAGDDWKEVGHGLVAYALDTRDEKWRLDVANDEPDDLLVAPLLLKPRRWVAGVDYTDRMTVRAYAACASKTECEAVAKAVEAFVARSQPAVASWPKAEASEQRSIARVAGALLRSCQVQRSESTVEVSAQTKGTIEDLAWFFMALTTG
jgi:hypothetical protein